jgi:hypothetical protein
MKENIMKIRFIRSLICASLMVVSALTTSFTKTASAAPAGEKNFLGRWDIDVLGSGTGIGRTRFCWLEIKTENGTLKGRLQPGEGATVDIINIKIENDTLTFAQVNQSNAVWKAYVKGNGLEGKVKSPMYGNATRTWKGIRGPAWPAQTPKRSPGKPVDLIGKDMSGWLLQNPDQPIGWSVNDGILENLGRQANNIYSKQKFQDFSLEAEFSVDPKSNSGIYLRGRYEIQIMDGYGASLNIHSQGALYGFITPPVNACKQAGEWQKFEITLIGNRVTVVLNGKKIIDNGEVPGITGGALDASEKESGPILIQGDHGKVKFRKLTITPLI